MVSRKKVSYAIVTLSGICVVTMQIYDLIFKFQLSLQIFFIILAQRNPQIFSLWEELSYFSLFC